MRKVTKNWTQRDGSKLRICDMTDRHLLNTIAILHRTHEHNLTHAYHLEATTFGEHAQYAAADIVRAMEDVRSDHPLYSDLLCEAERRGLTIPDFSAQGATP